MDNYKIKVKDEAESKEAQELFVQLGFEKTGFSCDEFPCYLATWEGGFSDYVLDSLNISRERKELPLPQLRDLVVLKRNDINDANWETEGGDQIFNDSNNKSYIYRTDGWDELQRHEMRQAMWEKPKAIAQPQDPALISGDVALANVHKCTVQYLHDDEPYGRWTTITDHFWSQYHLGMFLDPDTKFKFRFKPQTIKLELELPKPFKPRKGEYYFYLHSCREEGYGKGLYEGIGVDQTLMQFGAYRTEEEIKQVVEQLRKIRGTNS